MEGKKTEFVKDYEQLSAKRKKTIDSEIGRKYGMLTIESFAYIKRTDNFFNCRCDCGNHVIKRMSNLKTGHTTSCGCMAKSEKSDLTGQVFGSWTVLRHIESEQKGIYYLCRCVCGTERSVEKKRLVHGRSRSCGCMSALNRKKTFIQKGMMNEDGVFNDLTGKKFGRLTVIERVESDGEIPKGNNNRRKYVYWRCRCDCGTEKVILGANLTGGNVISCGCYQNEMRHIMGESSAKILGAVDGTNLYSVQNALEGKVYKINKTGVRGVSFDGRKYYVKIRFKNKEHYLGGYDTLEDATRVRKKAEGILYGEWLDYYNDDLKENFEEERDRLYQEALEKLKELKTSRHTTMDLNNNCP